jgi:hypothetical protein
MGRAYSPCGISDKICNVTLADSFGHVNFRCVKHPHEFLTHMLQYCICRRFLTLVGLPLIPYVSQGFEVKFELTAIVVVNVLALSLSAKPGPVD